MPTIQQQVDYYCYYNLSRIINQYNLLYKGVVLDLEILILSLVFLLLWHGKKQNLDAPVDS